MAHRRVGPSGEIRARAIEHPLGERRRPNRDHLRDRATHPGVDVRDEEDRPEGAEAPDRILEKALEVVREDAKEKAAA